MWVGLIQTSEDLNRTQRQTLLQVRRNSTCLTTLNLVPVFGLELKHQLFLSIKFLCFQNKTYILLAILVLRPSDLSWNYTISSPGFPVCLILGLPRLHNHEPIIYKKSQSQPPFIPSLYSQTHTYILLVLFLCRTLTLSIYLIPTRLLKPTTSINLYCELIPNALS